MHSELAISFSVIMPTFNQCAFIRRAVESLMRQTYNRWELIIVNDGATDDTDLFVSEYLDDKRITYIKLDENKGLGYALNCGLNAARYDYIAYLPSDDYFFKYHLSTISDIFRSNSDVAMACTGVRFDSRDSLHNDKEVSSLNVRKGFTMQLVQVAHRKLPERWVERTEWISDDLFAMYWRKLLKYGICCLTNTVSSYWTQHPQQRYRIINEKFGGGINKVRSYYKIKHPIKIKVSREKFIDEERLYHKFRKPIKTTSDGLKILLVGELAYNPERVYALEEAGHELYGLWTPAPALSFSTVGRLPFGNVKDVQSDNWREEVRKIKPDIIYAMLNCGAISWAYEVMRALPEIPFAWHYKEGPQLAMSVGLWSKLIYLYTHADVKIYLNDVVKCWFEQFIPKKGLSIIMDGDLPKRDYFKNEFSEKLSSVEGEIHTVCAGRLIGLGEKSLAVLANDKVHLHLYIENFHASRASLFQYYTNKFPKYFHLHNHCSAEDWTKEFSKYDAAWLHCIRSGNNGELMNATWDDLNIPARLNTYMAAGLPVIQVDNERSIVAVEECVRRYGIGIQFSNIEDVPRMLKDDVRMNKIRENVINNRDFFCFDHYVPELITAFRQVIKDKQNG